MEPDSNGATTSRELLIVAVEPYGGLWQRRHEVTVDGGRWTGWTSLPGSAEQGVDTNPRAAMSLGDSELWFHPKADGIHYSVYTNQNDWLVLRRQLCSGVVNPDGLVPNPVVCAENP